MTKQRLKTPITLQPQQQQQQQQQQQTTTTTTTANDDYLPAVSNASKKVTCVC